ncbi:MAG: ATP-binding protein [Spirosomataceae bacterium]
MKNRRLLVVLLLFAVSFTRGQSIITVDSIPEEGLILNKGWKWSAGDNLQWANPEFDDSQWKDVNPAEELSKIPQLTQKGIGWFRTTLEFSPIIAQKLTTLQINQSVASEIYINGVLAKKIGVISAAPDSVRAVNASRSIAIGLPYSVSYPFVQISIRIAYEQHSFYNRVGFTKNYCMRAILTETDNANSVKDKVKYQIYYGWFQVGVSFILTFLHLAFFFLYPTQRANFYFSLTTFFLGVAFLCIPLTLSYLESLSAYFLAELIQTISFPLAYIFLVRAIYEIYRQKTGILYGIIVAFGLVVVLLLFTPYSLGSTWVELVTELLMTAEVIRVTALALRRKQPGARLIMMGMGISLVMFTLFYAQLLLGYYTTEESWSIFTYQAGVLCVPMSISLYLAINFSVTNRDLIEKLRENNALTQRNLAQEQEKQHLLAVQNELLESQVKERTAQLEQSLEELKATQNQLVQREKMASLGELTAGIAHEIQNPLNFVNNFSEVSIELLQELKEEQAKEPEKRDEKVESEIFGDLDQNLQKIHLHGNRASSIVKSMLEHSRTNLGNAEPTDLNALIDEYLLLSYHSFRAKDKSFNATMHKDFDQNVGKIKIVAQDFGRVVLNLFNNAFYSINQRNAASPGEDYKPTVTVSTRRIATPSGAAVEIRVKDNGMGIPEAIASKIFQPFFTTKPTGQGTGLGLSLSYDIITKGHNGTLEVLTKENQGAEFIITVPV